MTACQRWTERSPSWRHTSEGGFAPSRYDVTELDETTAQAFVLTHHYSGTWPAARLRYGLYDRGALVGVLVLGVPMGANVLTGPLPTLAPYTESLELSRLVLLDEVPANAESWFAARAFEFAARTGVRGAVAFSDPLPRRLNGQTVMPGHVGTIYQALNADYTGTGTARTLTMLPDGTVFNARARAKLTGGERGADGVAARLVRLGAAPLADGQDVRTWLGGALTQVGATKVRHPGNHRYVFRFGPRRQRRHIVVGLPSLAYPKRDAGQLGLFGAVA